MKNSIAVIYLDISLIIKVLRKSPQKINKNHYFSLSKLLISVEVFVSSSKLLKLCLILLQQLMAPIYRLNFTIAVSSI